MEENIVENKELGQSMNSQQNKGQNTQQIAGAIVIAGLLIAGAVLLKGNRPPTTGTAEVLAAVAPAKVGASDRALGNPNAKVTVIMYEDFQCPFCGKFFKESEQPIRDTYVKDGSMQLVYRDFPFLGTESTKAAEAARCAGDQGKFWEYHDYLFNHQNGENQGSFADTHLEEFAKTIGLETATFNQCFTSGKYTQTVTDSKTEASNAGVTGTPKGFLVLQKDISSKMQNEIKALPGYSPQLISFYKAKNILSLNGALSWSMVKSILDISLK